MKAEEIKIRCSQLGNILTEPQLKADKEAGKLSATAKNYLIQCMVEARTGSRKELDNKYLKKGLAVEQKSIELYSEFCFGDFIKNEESRENEYLTGTADIIFFNKVIDIKSSYDAFTFFKNKKDGINKLYEAQLQGYMELYDKDEATLVYVLSDTPQDILEEEIKRLSYQYTNKVDFDFAVENLLKLHDNSVWTLDERIHEIHLKRDRQFIDVSYRKIIKSREYINNFFKC